MDIKIGRHSFNAKTLRTITKDKALKSYGKIDREIVEKAWNEANPKRKNRASK